jgi:hypothetical protein
MTYGEPEYDDDADRPEIQWRHLRTAVTLLLLVGVMVAAAYFGWQRIAGDADNDPVAEPCAPSTQASVPAPGDIEINVYNATNRNGLASQVADQMRERGFVVAEIANDPLDKDVTGTAEIRGNAAQQGAAALLTTTVPSAVFVPDDREVATLDVVLGDAFEALAAPDAPAPQPTQPAEECTVPPATTPAEAPAT